MSDRDQRDTPRRLPPWLLGLIIAAVLFALGFLVFSSLGFGDDPVVEQILIPNALVPIYGHNAARKRVTR